MKRLFDLFLAITGLLITGPLMLLIGILIRATSPGPIFFRQIRVGRHEKYFRIYKFRTMVQEAEKLGTSVTTQTDPRITPLGRFLRNTKLDELPQLINVLKGDMSIVGPRPDVPEIVAAYTPEMRKIFNIRPGVTSLATLHLKDEESILAGVKDPDKFYKDVLVPLKVKLAMGQVKKKSFFFDLMIVLQTIYVLLPGCRLKGHPEVEKIRKG